MTSGGTCPFGGHRDCLVGQSATLAQFFFVCLALVLQVVSAFEFDLSSAFERLQHPRYLNLRRFPDETVLAINKYLDAHCRSLNIHLAWLRQLLNYFVLCQIPPQRRSPDTPEIL